MNSRFNVMTINEIPFGWPEVVLRASASSFCFCWLSPTEFHWSSSLRSPLSTSWYCLGVDSWISWSLPREVVTGFDVILLFLLVGLIRVSLKFFSKISTLHKLILPRSWFLNFMISSKRSRCGLRRHPFVSAWLDSSEFRWSSSLRSPLTTSWYCLGVDSWISWSLPREVVTGFDVIFCFCWLDSSEFHWSSSLRSPLSTSWYCLGADSWISWSFPREVVTGFGVIFCFCWLDSSEFHWSSSLRSPLSTSWYCLGVDSWISWSLPREVVTGFDVIFCFCWLDSSEFHWSSSRRSPLTTSWYSLGADSWISWSFPREVVTGFGVIFCFCWLDSSEFHWSSSLRSPLSTSWYCLGVDSWISPFLDVMISSALSLRTRTSDASNFPSSSMSATKISPFQIHLATNANPRNLPGKTFLPKWWSL